MKPAPTVKLTEKERTTLSNFLMMKSKSQFPKQDTERFSRIINVLGHPGKKDFTVAEYKLICREVKVAAKLILNWQNMCLKIIGKSLPEKDQANC